MAGIGTDLTSAPGSTNAPQNPHRHTLTPRG